MLPRDEIRRTRSHSFDGSRSRDLRGLQTRLPIPLDFQCSSEASPHPPLIAQYSTSETNLGFRTALANSSCAPSGHPVTLGVGRDEGGVDHLCEPRRLGRRRGNEHAGRRLGRATTRRDAGDWHTTTAEKGANGCGAMHAVANFRVGFLTNTRLSEERSLPGRTGQEALNSVGGWLSLRKIAERRGVDPRQGCCTDRHGAASRRSRNVILQQIWRR